MAHYNFFCFHGCGQTPFVFQQLLKNLEKNAKTKHKFDCEFYYVQGNFKLKENGYSWYKESNGKIDLQEREINLSKTFSLIKNSTNVILVGFSEGALYILDLTLKYFKNKVSPIIGLLSIAPPYSIYNKINDICNIPGILIVSDKDENVPKKESEKWMKHFTNLIKYTNNKGHKIYLPLNIRDEIMKLLK